MTAEEHKTIEWGDLLCGGILRKTEFEFERERPSALT